MEGAENQRILYLECFMMWILCVVWGKKGELNRMSRKESLPFLSVPHVFRGLLRLFLRLALCLEMPFHLFTTPQWHLRVVSKGSKLNQSAGFTEFHTSPVNYPSHCVDQAPLCGSAPELHFHQ